MRASLVTMVFVIAAVTASPRLFASDNIKGKEPLRVSHGEKITLADYLVPGKYTVFDFYSDFCPPCRALKPRLERIHATRENVALVVVDINRPGTHGIDWKSPVSAQYSLHSIPHLVIFDPSGKLVAEDHDHAPDARKFIEQHWTE